MEIRSRELVGAGVLVAVLVVLLVVLVAAGLPH
jgi:hypothetical protein